jgi:hypothetical protein
MPPAPDRMPATLAVQMIEPLPRGTMTFAAAWTARKTPTVLMRSTLFQCSAVSSIRPGRPPETPALANITSRPPCFSAAAISWSTTSPEATSPTMASPLPPAAVTWARVSVTLSDRSAMTT